MMYDDDDDEDDDRVYDTPRHLGDCISVCFDIHDSTREFTSLYHNSKGNPNLHFNSKVCIVMLELKGVHQQK